MTQTSKPMNTQKWIGNYREQELEQYKVDRSTLEKADIIVDLPKKNGNIADPCLQGYVGLYCPEYRAARRYKRYNVILIDWINQPDIGAFFLIGSLVQQGKLNKNKTILIIFLTLPSIREIKYISEDIAWLRDNEYKVKIQW